MDRESRCERAVNSSASLRNPITVAIYLKEKRPNSSPHSSQSVTSFNLFLIFFLHTYLGVVLSCDFPGILKYRLCRIYIYIYAFVCVLFMSECREERSEDVVGRGDDEGGGDDGGSGGRGGNYWKKTKERGHVCGGDRRKAKSSALFRFGKNKRAANPSSPGCFGRGVGAAGRGGGGCCRCFKQTPTVDSPVESQTSDPNSPEFTYEMLRAFIEKNDFYSKECNPHLDRGDNSGN